jgi:hypothetical protein
MTFKKNQIEHGLSLAQRGIFSILVIAALSGCNTAPPLPKADISSSDWTVLQGEAVWKRDRSTPELAGELILATNVDGRAFVQFTKTPFPMVIAQSTSNIWEVQVPVQNKRYSGHGNPPKRLTWLYLPKLLAGDTPPRGWLWKTEEGGRWDLRKPKSGESLEGYLSQ